MQEVDDQVCRRLGLLFRDPVPAIRDDHIFDVIGDTPHHRADHRAECCFATEGKDRHLKLALRKERPVVTRPPKTAARSAATSATTPAACIR
jgi:hypothetical protein